jgi:hypothetical protein
MIDNYLLIFIKRIVDNNFENLFISYIYNKITDNYKI